MHILRYMRKKNKKRLHKPKISRDKTNPIGHAQKQIFD